MKLVETDLDHKEDQFSESHTQPRPEHRRVYVSLFITLSVLVATVGIVYTVFPERETELVSRFIAFHEASPRELALSGVGNDELSNWAEGVLGVKTNIPKSQSVNSEKKGIELVGARSVTISRKPVVQISYRLSNYTASIFLLRSRGALPGNFHKVDGELAITSWREGRFTKIGVGPVAHESDWLPFIQRK